MQQTTYNNIAELCAKHQLKNIIISPGSRNAPLTLAFARHPQLKCFSISDERSAAFIALGMAQASQNTTVLICTSGSAALNYAPAIAEAYFQQTPLLILTADRPPEWIDQWDGQTIRQQNIFGQHIKRSFDLPVDLNHSDAKKQAYRIINEAILESNSNTPGPVQVNIPIREPFYPAKDFEWSYDKNTPFFTRTKVKNELSQADRDELIEAFKEEEKIAFLLGQEDYSPDFLKTIGEISNELNIPIFADAISNGHSIPNAIQFTDSIGMHLLKHDDDSFQPSLVISFGRSIISKNLKIFLRKSSTAQWHIQANHSFVADPFHALTKIIDCAPLSFLKEIKNGPQQSDAFILKWKAINEKMSTITKNYLTQLSDWNEFSALNQVLKAAKPPYQLHLANSLSVRYVNFMGVAKQQDVKVWANRGTSGIDGSTSTSIGHLLQNNDNPHVLITGDVAFFYDRNAFWNKYGKSNLKIILLNNHGGSIFRMIKGPNEQAELEEFFETEQNLNAEHLCEEFGITHLPVQSEKELNESISTFWQTEKPVILEILTESIDNQKIFEDFKKQLIQ